MKSASSIIAIALLLTLVNAGDPLVTPKRFVSGLLQLEWAGVDNEIVWALNNQGDVFRSENGGGEWVRQNNAMPGAAEKVGPKKNLSGVQHFFISHATDGQDVYFAGPWNKHWRTRDGGHTYEAVDAHIWYDPLMSSQDNSYVSWIRLHPTVPGYMMASSLDPDYRCVFNGGPVCKRNLYLSKDFGKTWELENEQVKQWDWGNGGVKPGVPEMWHAFIDSKDKTQSRQPDLTRNSDQYILESHEEFGSGGEVHKEPKVDQFIVGRYDDKNPTRFGNTFIYAMWVDLNPDNHQVEDVGLFVSNDDGKSYADITFEGTDPDELVYTVVDMRSSITISIKERDDYFTSGLWKSDASGQAYSKTLSPINHHRYRPIVDAVGVEGIEGVHFANQVLDLTDRRNSIVTKVNFDNANSYTWRSLTPPTVHWDGSPIELQEGDALHLFNLVDMVDTGYGVVYPMSDADAPGIIVACGTVGATLGDPFDAPNINTYISMDAGLTWREIANGPHWAEFGNHGGVLVLAPLHPTSEVLYSLDYFNEHRDTFTFTDGTEKVIVNILTEPDNHEVLFQVVALDGNDAMVYALDMTPTFDGAICKGMDAPEQPGKPDDGTDFEIWIPHNAGQDDCMLGRSVQFTRRKASSKCLNTASYEPAVMVYNCTCAEEDWECDTGFERVNNVCVLGHGASWPEPPKVCPPDGYWSKTQGYRKVAGDSCEVNDEGAVNRGPIQAACESGGPIGARGWLVLLILGFLATGLAAFTYIKRPDIVANLLGGDSKWGNPYEHTGPPQSLVDEDDEDDDGAGGAFGVDMETGPEELAGDSLTQALSSGSTPADEKSEPSESQSLVDLGDDTPSVPSSGGNKFGIQPM